MVNIITKALDSGEELLKSVSESQIVKDDSTESVNLSYKRTKKKWRTMEQKGIISIDSFLTIYDEARKRNIQLSNQDMYVFLVLCKNIDWNNDFVKKPKKALLAQSGLDVANFNKSIRRLMKLNLITQDEFKIFHVNADMLAYGYMDDLHKQGLMAK